MSTREGSTVSNDREKGIIRTSIIGIMANIVLAVFKAVMGLASNSIAIVLDAVNNLSDALSSVITIIGTKLAGRKPDKKHPYGHGRIEYMSQVIVAAIVLYAGITSLVESGKKIISPEKASYSTVTLIILAVAIGVKLVLGTYVKNKGRQMNSGSLVASGSDAFFDAILSASVLASALIFMGTGISLEAYVGVVIAGFIIKSGVEMIMEAVNEMLGIRAPAELTRQIKDIIRQEPEVHGVYDLFMHNYGPDYYQASCHVEVDDSMNARQIDALTRRISLNVYKQSGVILVAVGVYAMNTSSDEMAQIRTEVTRIVMGHEGILQMHGFYLDTEKKIMTFDIVIDFAVDDRDALHKHITDEIAKKYPEYTVYVAPDSDVSD